MAIKSNPNVGRHGIGAPGGRFVPNRPSTGASGNYGVGTGRNQKTAARPEYQANRPKLNDNGQAEQWLDRSPEPFASQRPYANPRRYQVGTTGAGNSQTLVSQPGQHPFRAPGRPVMGQGSMDAATGHAGGKGAGRTGRGVSGLTSGQPLTSKSARNKDNSGQPSAKNPFGAKGYEDLAQGYAQYKKWGG